MYNTAHSITSVLSLALMAYFAFFSADQLSLASTAYYHAKNRGENHQPFEVNSFQEFVKVVPCFFPDLLYSTTNASEEIKEACNIHPSPLKDERTPIWIKLPFYFATWGAVLGFFFELVLVLIGIPFETQVNEISTLVKRFRVMNLPCVFCSVNYVVLAMAFESITGQFIGCVTSIWIACFLVPKMFTIRPWKPSSWLLMGMQLFQIAVCLFKGLTFGGSFAGKILALAPIFQIAAMIANGGTPSPLKSTIFHVLSSFTVIFCYIGISLFANSSPSSPDDIETNMPSPFVMKMSGMVGFIMILHTRGVKEDLVAAGEDLATAVFQDEKKKLS
jgi:hypothetical protein